MAFECEHCDWFCLRLDELAVHYDVEHREKVSIDEIIDDAWERGRY